MKIVNIIGGLGNQMFQYAFAISLKNKCKNEEILIDIHHFNYYKLHNGLELFNIFKNLEIQVATKEQIKKVSRFIPHYALSRLIRKLLPNRKAEYIEPCNYIYNEKAFQIIGDCYYEGYWQSYYYYEKAKKEIITAFQFPEPSGYNKKMVDEISSCKSVGVHIRRGDYLKHKDFKGICELDYYQRAINKLLSKSKDFCFYIFSNDIQWCKENIQPLIGDNKVTYVTENRDSDSFWDMYLMSKCYSLIIANSSFSWWGAFLNSDAHYIYAPNRWVNRNQSIEVYNPNWIKI